MDEEPVVRCMTCHRDVLADEISTWSRDKTPEFARAWWAWQVVGTCAGCTQLEYEIAIEEIEDEEGVILRDGCI